MGAKLERIKMPSSAELKALIDYDPETGHLTWKVRPVSMFPAPRNAGMWNTRFAGTRAFSVNHHAGYLYGELNGRAYLAHRIVWALVHDQTPDEIDHLNGQRDDNRIKNLRAVSRRVNCRNTARSMSANSSGIVGVCWDKRNSKWTVRIRTLFIGRFVSFDEAVRARKAAERKYKFHPNHGREP